MSTKTYFIRTFGCQQNEADSERIASQLKGRGIRPAKDIDEADHIIINTCMIRESAENRVYGLVNNLYQDKKKGRKVKVVVTGCMVGMAARDKSGKFLKKIKDRMPGADELLPIEEVGFDHAPLRTNNKHAWVPVSNGCNNFCTFCVVPFTRGREISRPFKDILDEVNELADKGYTKITLLGMNVNSYGADLIVNHNNIQVLRDLDNKKYFNNNIAIEQYNNKKKYKLPNGKKIKPIRVNHLGRSRLPTLFPYLLEEVCKIDNIKEVAFMSSNPWDFTDELIEVIARNPKVIREIHLPVQAGSNSVLKRMNRWYTKEKYLKLINKMRENIPDVEFSTDIIVGFCGESKNEFADTVDLVKKAKFKKAYISRYSDRPMTAAHKSFKDNIPYAVKKHRWQILENLINK